MDIVNLLNYMENLRYDRKMTQDVYLEGVISQRQYYRYRSGESEVPFDVIIKFANKLQIPLLKLISSFQQHSEKEKEVVKEYMNLVMNRELTLANKLLKKHPNLMLLDEETQMFFQSSRILFDFYLNKLTNEEMIEKLKEKIDFNNIMKKEILHDSEIYLLGIMMEYSDDDRENILLKIEDLSQNDKLLLSGNALFNSQVFFWIIKNLGRLNKFNELITMANRAIKHSKSNFIYYLLEYFHYYKALAFLRQGLDNKFENELLNTIYVLLQLDEQKRSKFFQVIKKDTDISSKEFLIARLKKELE
ncbi:MAG: hypothetical protein K9L64_04860 [Candidatus Izimaplasma sp.]|nr:hypothetical protein [Candidatus Izimaplasma bacterium]